MSHEETRKYCKTGRCGHFDTLTFNQVVRGSSPRTLMKENKRKPSIYQGFRYFSSLSPGAMCCRFLLFRMFHSCPNVPFVSQIIIKN